MSEFNFRKSKEADIHNIMQIINDAKSYFKSQGIDQWQNGYPNEETILDDIKKGQAYLLENNSEVLGTLMYSLEEESTYNHIYDGKWLTSGKYGVIHRIAVSDKHKGLNIAAKMLETVEQMTIEKGIHSIKIDTHKDNKSMQKFLKKNGFEYCGEIILSDGSLRIAFEKRI